MKKLLILGVAAASLAIGLSACAETASGKVVKSQGNTVVIRDANGVDHTMKTTSDTTYRKKRATPNTQTTPQPIFVEDDYVEVIYSPSTDSELIIEDAVIYEN